MTAESPDQESAPEAEDKATAETEADKERRAEALRWLEQAESDLVAARDNIAAKHYNWACYMSEQAGEKAVKAVYVFRAHPFKRIHWIADLISGDELRGLPGVPELKDLADVARQLDQMLTSTRYPDAVPGIALPSQFYVEYEAEECLQWAQQIVASVRNIFPTT